MMFFNRFLIFTYHKQPTNRKSANMFRLWNPCFLKQWQTTTTCTNKDECRSFFQQYVSLFIVNRHFPSTVRQLLKITHTMMIMHAHLFVFQMCEQHSRKRAE